MTHCSNLNKPVTELSSRVRSKVGCTGQYNNIKLHTNNQRNKWRSKKSSVFSACDNIQNIPLFATTRIYTSYSRLGHIWK